MLKPTRKLLMMLDNLKYSLLVLSFLFSSLAVAEEFVFDESFRMARSNKIQAEQIEFLLKSPSVDVREALAQNRRVKSNSLFKLASDSSERVRIAVATNLSTDTKTHNKLAQDKALAVRSVVARFEYVPTEALALLANDISAEIRLEVARNLNTLEPTLNKLLLDDDPDVKAVAEQALQRLKDEKL